MLGHPNYPYPFEDLLLFITELQTSREHLDVTKYNDAYDIHRDGFSTFSNNLELVKALAEARSRRTARNDACRRIDIPEGLIVGPGAAEAGRMDIPEYVPGAWLDSWDVPPAVDDIDDAERHRRVAIACNRWTDEPWEVRKRRIRTPGGVPDVHQSARSRTGSARL